MSSLFARKPIGELLAEGENQGGLKRSLGAADLIMLAIGAVIGAGIFSSIGTAAAGQVDAAGQVIRYGAGPALVLSFILLGVACALAGLCYAELASMIPQAGSAYAYSYATLGELVAWIIGWDLILEYAVGNVAVAISWGDYFNSFLEGVIGWRVPAWLSTGYRTALLSADPKIHGLLDTAPHVFGIPIVVHVPAFVIVMLITWLLLRGARESTRVNNIMVAVKLLALALFVVVGLRHINSANYHPFAPNGFRGIHQGAAIVFFAYIGFDAISTAAEETRNPQRNMPLGILGGLAICTLIYVVIGAVLTGMVPWRELAVADPLAYAMQKVGVNAVSWLVALGAVFSTAAVLLVFQYGQPRIFYAMGRDGLLPRWAAKVHPRTRIPYTTTIITGIFVACWSLIGDAAETYDLTNIGTLSAFILVCLGVLVLRIKEPDRPRPFRVPFVWGVTVLGAVACLFVMAGLPGQAWERFVAWLGIGGVLFFAYGFSHSTLRRHAVLPRMPQLVGMAVSVGVLLGSIAFMLRPRLDVTGPAPSFAAVITYAHSLDRAAARERLAAASARVSARLTRQSASSAATDSIARSLEAKAAAADSAWAQDIRLKPLARRSLRNTVLGALLGLALGAAAGAAVAQYYATNPRAPVADIEPPAPIEKP